ncbi:hypothetical protein [Mycobacterium sp. 3519A]|uniref:hypothetical protein n=1 Tax=Mycobacterium sp. 3519A TaxID=2057184 RepID=UPI001156E932|nr:hypothetical protein [Mycobacterium sp. 3519A]
MGKGTMQCSDVTKMVTLLLAGEEPESLLPDHIDHHLNHCGTCSDYRLRLVEVLIAVGYLEQHCDADVASRPSR